MLKMASQMMLEASEDMIPDCQYEVRMVLTMHADGLRGVDEMIEKLNRILVEYDYIEIHEEEHDVYARMVYDPDENNIIANIYNSMVSISMEWGMAEVCGYAPVYDDDDEPEPLD